LGAEYLSGGNATKWHFYFMEEKIGFGAYVVIPTALLMDENVSSQAKLSFGIISNLSNQRGYCFASNSYISKLLNVHENTVSKHIGELINTGYLIRFDEVTPVGLQRRLALSDPIKDEMAKRNDLGGSTEIVRGSHKKRLGGVNENVDHNSIRLIVKEEYINNIPDQLIKEIGQRNDKFIIISPKEINSIKYRINGEDGVQEYFDMHQSIIPRPEYLKKFLMERTGKPYSSFSHLWNDFNQFVNNQFKR